MENNEEDVFIKVTELDHNIKVELREHAVDKVLASVGLIIKSIAKMLHTEEKTILAILYISLEEMNDKV